MSFRNIGAWFGAYYDKLITVGVLVALVASLLYLAIRVGMIPIMQKSFDRDIEENVPEHPHAQAVDESVFGEVRDRLASPHQTGGWAHPLSVPETRVWCVDCRRPIPVDAEECPFCSALQPEDPEQRRDFDGDGDGMPDWWEIKYGLNPFDPGDAHLDMDGDGFTNLEEFLAGTDPTDPDSHPPYATALRLERIDAEPFLLRFRSVVTMPDGSLRFGLNLGGDVRTYFSTLGESVEGFELASYEPRTEMRVLPGSTRPRSVDTSVLTLVRGDQRIELTRDEQVPYMEYAVHLWFRLDDERLSVKALEPFALRGREYQVIEIDSEGQSVLLERLHDGERFEILMNPGG